MRARYSSTSSVAVRLPDLIALWMSAIVASSTWKAALGVAWPTAHAPSTTRRKPAAIAARGAVPTSRFMLPPSERRWRDLPQHPEHAVRQRQRQRHAGREDHPAGRARQAGVLLRPVDVQHVARRRG